MVLDLLFFAGPWSLFGWLALGVGLKIWYETRFKVRGGFGPDLGWLYFIGNGEGPIKVGITRGDPKERLKDLQTGNPVRLRVLDAFSVVDPEGTEQRMHNALRDFHVGGEWYDRDAVLHLLDELKGNVKNADGETVDNVIPFPRRRGAA